MIAESFAMTTPKQLKEFREDYATIKDGLPIARLHLKAVNDERLAKATIKRTRLVRLNVGRALFRIHSTESWRGAHYSWAAMCRSLNLIREHSYQLMNYANIHDSLPPEFVAGMPDKGLSKRQVETLKIADQDQRDEMVEEAVETGDAEGAFETLRAELEAAPLDAINDMAPVQPKAVNWLARVKRQFTSVYNSFNERGKAEDALQTPLGELVALAEGKEAKLADIISTTAKRLLRLAEPRGLARQFQPHLDALMRIAEANERDAGNKAG